MNFHVVVMMEILYHIYKLNSLSGPAIRHVFPKFLRSRIRARILDGVLQKVLFYRDF